MGGRYINPFVSGDFLPLSGGTVTGTTYYTDGLSGNSISAGTFFFESSSGNSINSENISFENSSGNSLSATSVFVKSGFTFGPNAATGKILVSSDNEGNAHWDDLQAIVSGGTRISGGQNIFTGGTLLNPVINLVDSPSVNNFSSSGLSSHSEIDTKSLTSSTITATSEIAPMNDNTVDLGTPVRRFRNLNTINGVAVNFTATTIHFKDSDLEITEHNIVLTGDTIDSGLY